MTGKGDSKLTRSACDGWEKLQGKEDEVFALSERYKHFLSTAKTERQGAKFIVEQAEKNGYKPLGELSARNQSLTPGDKVYWVHQHKVVIMAIVGREPLTKGVKLVGAHLDAPRLDLKPNPLFEAKDLALFKTHYYGGIKKYHWLGMPLALHGVIYLANGSKLEISIGEEPGDPVFTITDLLPHLAKEQMAKKLGEAIAGEGLNILVGSRPAQGKNQEEKIKEPVKTAILTYLHEKYGLIEEDFISGEVEVVPAGPARDVGIDRSMVGGYGQDDRACAYPLLEAILAVADPVKTAVAVFVDKEEIGSTGSTGMQARILPYFLTELGNLADGKQEEQQKNSTNLGRLPLELVVRRCLVNSRALSADVSVAEDPNYEGVLEKQHAAQLGKGVVITKYTGVGGKSGASDANAEMISYLRKLLSSQEDICWQVAELGKVDQGGGGTIARFLGEYGMEVIDCGPPVLSMHSPFEVVAKVDLYMTFRTYQSFLHHD